MTAAAALSVDWLKLGAAPLLHTPGKIGISTCPGRPDCQSQLDADLAELQRLRIATVLSLVDDEEMARYGVTTLAAGLQRAGLRHLRFPMADGFPPTDLAATRVLCRQLLGLLGEGENLLIHCIGGWGRSGTVAASLLTHEGYAAQRAIELVRRARSPRCVESMAQELFVQRYAREQQAYGRRYHFLPAAEARTALSGRPGARLLGASGGALLLDVSVDLLPRALFKLQRRAGEVVALSGEVELGAPIPAGRPIDRAYRIADGGLLPMPLAGL